jgi:hypothetical protein
MIFEDLSEILKIIKSGRPDWFELAEKEHLRLNVHINGIGTSYYLKKIDSIENDEQLSLRKKYLTTNRYLFTNLIRPIDKVFSAKGGNRIIPEKSKDTISKLTNLTSGLPIRKWIENIQSNKYYTDPAGIVFIEHKDYNPYPTLKSIKSIFNYGQNGRLLEWIIFKPFKIDDRKGDFYRVVDDEKDIIVNVVDDSNIIEVEELNGEKQSFENPFGKVPAILNSDKINSQLLYMESPFEDVISLADHYLRTGTIKNLNEFLHGFPIFWRYLTDCKECKGTGFIDGKKCDSCNGRGKSLNKDITDIIQVEKPEVDEAVITPNVAGWVVPPVESWREMRVEMDWINDLMQLTTWGSKMAKDATNETATSAFLNIQPVNERLNNFSDTYENLENHIIEFLSIFYNEKKGVSSYGRRYLIELPDVIWKKYQEAREKGVAKALLNYLLRQYFQTEYANDIESMMVAENSMKYEPFIHKTDEEVLAMPILEYDKFRKIYFNEFYIKYKPSEILELTQDKFNKQFDKFLEKKHKQFKNENDGQETQ